MVDTPRSLPELLALFPSGVAREISAQDLRDFVMSVMERNVGLAAQGLITETFSRSDYMTTYTPISGTVYYMGLPLLAGRVITSIAVIVSSGSANLTLAKVGLYDSVMNRVAISADQSASWATVGLKVVNLIAPYMVTVSGFYYAAFMLTGLATLQTVRQVSTNNAAIFAALPGASQLYGTQTGQVDLPNPGILPTTSLGTAYIWLGFL